MSGDAIVDAVVTGAGGGERFDGGDRVVTILADLPQPSVLEIEFGPSFEVPAHSHDDLHPPDAGFAEAVRRQ